LNKKRTITRSQRRKYNAFSQTIEQIKANNTCEIYRASISTKEKPRAKIHVWKNKEHHKMNILTTIIALELLEIGFKPNFTSRKNCTHL